MDYPLIDAESSTDCFHLLDDLKGRGYIQMRQHKGPQYAVALMPPGRKHLEEVSRQVIGEMDYVAVSEAARPDLMKAAARYKAGDLSGALAAACGAVDSACARVYEECGEGDSFKAHPFQQKVIRSLRLNGALKRLELELIGLGWNNNDAHKLAQRLEKSLSEAAYVMQSLRSNMSDAHGSKPVLEAVVFDSLKWAMIIASQLK